MEKKQNRSKRLCAALLALLVLAGAYPLPARAAEADVVLRTAEDLAELAENCALDTWSRGKTVVLAADIDLRGETFTPIPTFGGTFAGGGHTISGLNLSGSGSVQGLFRYVQEGGTVQDLHIKGVVSPSGSKSSVGGIAGSNRGSIIGCTVSATVRGRNNVGGIAGVNEGTGRLVACTFSGTLTGEHYAGGIAGQNLGSAVRCRNTGAVNTTEVRSTVGLDDLDLDRLNAAENVPVSTDIGGVAGLSAGVLQSCRNEGSVGYEHVGYNVGGIAGRQSGYLGGCTNTGRVCGRKDVGGIVGQLEPDLLLKYNEDTLDRLWKELDRLQGIMQGTLDRTGGSGDRISGAVSSLTGQAGDVKDRVQDLSDALTGWGNDNIGEINDLSAAISRALDRIDPAIDSAEEAMEAVEESVRRLEEALASGELAAVIGKEAAEELARSVQLAKESVTAFRAAKEQLRTGREQLAQALVHLDWEAAKAAAGTLRAGIEGLRKAGTLLREAADALRRAVEVAEGVGDPALDLIRELKKAVGPMADGVGLLAAAADALGEAVRELTEGDGVHFRPLDSLLTERGDALDGALGDLLGGMDALNDVLSSSSDTLLEDLRAVSRQMGVVTEVLQDSAGKDEDGGDRFEDVSDQSAGEDWSTGVVSDVCNSGPVCGDVNVAGIAGSLAIEYDFDPEDDLTTQGQRSLDFRYQARAMVRRSVNQGAVTGKKDCIGGVAGLVDLGSVNACENYGSVTSSGGSYVGGIAGACYGVIRACWAKCTLDGGDYVGGIAGYGSSILDCRALTDLLRGGEYLGAVAGSADPDGSLRGNLFVSRGTAGVDGVSYAGKAEPIPFAALEAAGGMPDSFSRFALTFLADGREVAVVPFPYGGSLDALPDIPPKEGCSARWPELDLTDLTFSQTLEAEYTPYASALGDGSGNPQVLVDGSFSGDADIHVKFDHQTWTDSNGRTHSGPICTVQVEDPVLETGACTVHYRLEEPKRPHVLWVRTPTGWQQQDFVRDGSYLLLESEGPEITFCVIQEGMTPLGWLLLGGLGVAAAGLFLVLCRKKRAH